MSSIDPIVTLPSSHREAGSERRRAVRFGATIAVACAVIGLWGLHRGASSRGYAFLAAGALLLSYSIVHPAGALVLRRGWLFIGGVLGRINSVIILSFAYVFVLTPLSLLVRLVSRRSFKPRRGQSYFAVRSDQRDEKHFEHPY